MNSRFQTWPHRPHAKASDGWVVYDTIHPYRDKGRSTIQIGTMLDELTATALVVTLNEHAEAFDRHLIALSEAQPF
jgi:hypothetical protein